MDFEVIECAPGAPTTMDKLLAWKTRAVQAEAALAQVPEAMRRAYAAGWRTCANWQERNDLHADIGSPAYEAERDAAMADMLKEGS